MHEHHDCSIKTGCFAGRFSSPLEGTDYIEFYVVAIPNRPPILPKQHLASKAFAYAGPETGIKDRASYADRTNSLLYSQHRSTAAIPQPIMFTNTAMPLKRAGTSGGRRPKDGMKP